MGKLEYGVSTHERISKDQPGDGMLHMDIVSSTLAIGTTLANMRPCTVEELWHAARKLNHYDEMLSALEDLLSLRGIPKVFYEQPRTFGCMHRRDTTCTFCETMVAHWRSHRNARALIAKIKGE